MIELHYLHHKLNTFPGIPQVRYRSKGPFPPGGTQFSSGDKNSFFFWIYMCFQVKTEASQIH